MGPTECGARRTRAPRFWSSHRAKRFEGCANVGDEERRLFPGREMSALRMGLIIEQIGIGTLRPALRCLIDLFGKRADADRKLDASGVEEAGWRQIMRRVPVEPRRRDRGV